MACTCVPDGNPQFCLTRGVGTTLVFQYQREFELGQYTEALFTAKKNPDEDPDDSAAVIRATGTIDAEARTVSVTLTDEDTLALRGGWFYWYDLALLVVDGGPASVTSGGRFSVVPAITNRRTVDA